jgi:hypothetical protein
VSGKTRRGIAGMLRALMLAAVACAPRAGLAADGQVAAPSPLPIWHVGPYGGIGLNSPGGDKWGAVADRNHLILGVRGSADVLRWGKLAVAFAPEIVPALIISDNPIYETVPMRQGGVTRQTQVVVGSGPVYGLGIAPLGTEVLLRTGSTFQAFAAVAVGVVWFTRAVPVANSKAYNYTIEMGGGLLWEYGQGRRVRFGYMFHHLSNAWSATENPGLDGDIFYVGIERTVALPGP